MTGAEMLVVSKVVGPAMSLTVQVIQPYVATGLKRRYRNRLAKALEGALVANVEVPQEQGKESLPKDTWNKLKAKLPGRKARGRLGDSSVVMDAMRGGSAAAAAGDSRFHWRQRFAAALATLVDRDTEGDEAETWSALIGSRATADWADAVSHDFALRMRADAHLTFVVAQLEAEDERAGFALAASIARQFVTAVLFLGVSLICAAALLTVALVTG